MRLFPHHLRRRHDGSIVILLLALVAIMMILFMAETRSLYHLHREVKLLEQRQIKRLSAPHTNVVANLTLSQAK